MNKITIPKNTIYIFILVSLLLISSCVPQEGSSSQTTSRSSSTNGLQISFMRGMPPDRFYVEEGHNSNVNFEIGIEINNKGEYPQSDIGALYGHLYLTGFDSSILRNRQWDGGDKFDKIRGVSPSYPEGDTIYKSFRAQDIYFPSQSREYPMSLVLNACYYYETVAVATICVDPNPTRVSQGQACVVGDVRLNPQKAPVQVTSIRQTPRSSELVFDIEINNRGSGTVLREFGGHGVVSSGQCMEALMSNNFDDVDRIAVEATITGLPSGSCSPSASQNEPLRLLDGRTRLTCRFSVAGITSDSAYTTQMTVKLRYGYHISERTDVTLVNIARN